MLILHLKQVPTLGRPRTPAESAMVPRRQRIPRFPPENFGTSSVVELRIFPGFLTMHVSEDAAFLERGGFKGGC